MQLYTDENLRVKRHSLYPSVKNQFNSTPHNARIDAEEFINETHERRCVLRRGKYQICLADSPRRYNLVNKLVKSMYSWRGYDIESTPISSHNPNRLTLEASMQQQLIGTLTLGLDSADGLLVDALYRQEVGILRTKERKICELSKLAINPLHSSTELLAALFNLAYIYGRIIHKATDFVIEVNPRHAGYYKRVLGFRQIGEIRICERVNAPAVLLRLELDYVDAQVARLAGSHEPKQRSLYTYFLTKPEEEKVANSFTRYSSRVQ